MTKIEPGMARLVIIAQTAGMNGLLLVYLLGGILEILGILYTGKIGLRVVKSGGLAYYLDQLVRLESAHPNSCLD